ncbi:MAG: hypothetical protein OEV40_01480 [Acidimicrobiia bacterium]|nr:hypothetical protein [Acidimicrobiia bacterium]
MSSPRFAFVASTGRTATTFLAATLERLSGVAAFHEGHDLGDPPSPRLPLINLQNGPAWHDPCLAQRTVAERRDRATLQAAAGDADLTIDVAFYNAPLLRALAARHPTAHLLAVFRRCESFVRSATIIAGEDRQPAGWPDPGKELTARERFIALGRLRPRPRTPEAEAWPQWSGIQRNIWLWHAVNTHLATMVEELPPVVPLFFEQLVDEPHEFWSACLAGLGIDKPEYLAPCLERSSARMNARSEYQIGPASSWNPAERESYERIALPLEAQLYD